MGATRRHAGGAAASGNGPLRSRRVRGRVVVALLVSAGGGLGAAAALSGNAGAEPAAPAAYAAATSPAADPAAGDVSEVAMVDGHTFTPVALVTADNHAFTPVVTAPPVSPAPAAAAPPPAVSSAPAFPVAATTPAATAPEATSAADAAPTAQAPSAVAPPATPAAAASAAAPASAASSPASSPSVSAPSAAASPATAAEAAAAQQLLALVNQQRSAIGCQPLRPDPRLGAVAQQHSEDMQAQHYFGHDGGGGTPWTRMAAAGYPVGTGGESIAEGQPDPAAVTAAFLGASRQSNILNCGFSNVGIGVAYGSGGPWWTLDLGAPQ